VELWIEIKQQERMNKYYRESERETLYIMNMGFVKRTVNSNQKVYITRSKK